MLFVVEYTHDSIVCQPDESPGYLDIGRNYLVCKVVSGQITI